MEHLSKKKVLLIKVVAKTMLSKCSQPSAAGGQAGRQICIAAENALQEGKAENVVFGWQRGRGSHDEAGRRPTF